VSVARDRLRWNGWGRLGESMALSPARREALLASLGELLGRELRPAVEPVALEAVTLPAPRIGEATLRGLRACCGTAGVRTGHFERVTHAAGRSLPDLLRLRAGDLAGSPDAVVYPPDEGAVAAVLRVAAAAGVAVVPFGGGTSVVGGVEPRLAEGQSAVIALDTTHMDALLRVDPRSGTATVQAGILGPDLEEALARHDLTLGHFPQSFEHSTLGGWIATRSTGQLSNGYGGIERMLVAVRVVTPEGVLRTLEVPRSAAGPDLNALVLGSEGTLGVIVEATLRVRPRAVHHEERGLLFRDFASGVEALREAVVGGVPVAMLRLADGRETGLYELLRRDPARRFDPAALGLAVAARFGFGPGRCAMIAAAEGPERAPVHEAMVRLRRIARRHGALPLGRSPGRSWRRDRFRTPYLRDLLLDHDVAVDTFETALPWSRLEAAHASITTAAQASLERHAGSGVAMAHLSHAYRDGASLYFTVLYPVDPSHAVKQWTAIKRDVTEAVVSEGGTVSHHHGVGVDHARWLGAEKGSVGLGALRAAKSAVDPQGVMNPGKLL
jgi:alkyldihydroxyacetonephosphate synthase